MQYKYVGTSNLNVSQLCLGTMMFGGQTERGEAFEIIKYAKESGVNFIDTANNYAEGRSEEIVGQAVKGSRDQWIIASKVGFVEGLEREVIRHELELSRQRLDTDYIDVYYAHRTDMTVPWAEIAETFGLLIEERKIKHWGVSNVSGWEIVEIVRQSERLGTPAPIIIQPCYNLLNRECEVEILPAAHHLRLGVASYSPLARGVLSGKYKSFMSPEAGTRAGRGDKRMMETEWRRESIQIADQLSSECEKHGIALLELALSWVVRNAAITAAIVGPRTLEQWKAYRNAFNLIWKGEFESMVSKYVPEGQTSTPNYRDPLFPVRGRY